MVCGFCILWWGFSNRITKQKATTNFNFIRVYIAKIQLTELLVINYWLDDKVTKVSQKVTEDSRLGERYTQNYFKT